MITTMEYKNESPFRRWWNGLDFFQKRLVRMGLSFLVMIICFPLYYLGLFGSVQGPLNPSNLGEGLANLGVTRTHSAVFFLTLLILAVSWNWIFNLVSIAVGASLTCKKTREDGKSCGARVERKKTVQKKTGKIVPQYVCSQGHKLPEADFHPVQKGTFSHTLWVIALVFCFIVFFLS
jgi:hypothetical protein